MQTIVLIEIPTILISLISLSKQIKKPSGISASPKTQKETEYMYFPSPQKMIGKSFDSVERKLSNLGFSNVECKQVRRSGFSLIRKKDVVDIRVYGQSIAMEKEGRSYPADTKIEILY